MEYRDLYDKERNLTGKVIKKDDLVPSGYYYITVMVFIENLKGEILLQKRSKEKGGAWATTGGHPKSGQSSLEGMQAEIKEELGITIRQDELKLFKTIKTDDDFVDIYYLKSNIDIKDITVQPEEVEKVKWATIEEINKLIDEGDFLPPHIEFFQYCLEYLDKK